MRYPAPYWINKLHLTPHAEGGFFSETYRSDIVLGPGLVPALAAERNLSTGIYFLLEQGQFSAFHRIASDELWHFYSGDPLQVFELQKDGRLVTHHLGSDPEQNQRFQCVVKAGNWFASAPAPQSAYSLCGCTVCPGFDYNDFELADRAALTLEFPQYESLIALLTR